MATIKRKAAPKKKAGRPAYEANDRDRNQVKLLSGLGLRDNEVALVLGISPPTMRKYYADELQVGHLTATAKVAESLFKAATAAKPNVVAGIFWMKCRAQWNDRPDQMGKKGEREEAAKEAATGKYKLRSPPKLKAVK